MGQTKPFFILYYNEGPGTSVYPVLHADSREDCEAYIRRHNNSHARWEIVVVN